MPQRRQRLPHRRRPQLSGVTAEPPPGLSGARTGFAASRPSAGFRIPSASCWISPGATMPEPIGPAPEPKTGDRRTARMGLVGDGRAAGVRNVVADYQALAPSAPSSCRSRARWLVMPRRRQGFARRLRADLRENALQCLNAWGQRIPIGIYGVGQ